MRFCTIAVKLCVRQDRKTPHDSAGGVRGYAMARPSLTVGLRGKCGRAVSDAETERAAGVGSERTRRGPPRAIVCSALLQRAKERCRDRGIEHPEAANRRFAQLPVLLLPRNRDQFAIAARREQRFEDRRPIRARRGA